MQEKDKEFDLRLRSMLDGVEEEVPQHVWEAVSGRIGRRRTPAAWMRWAGAGMAAAAAVALALVLGGTFRGGIQSPAVEPAALLADAVTETAAGPETVEEEIIPEGIQTATTRRTARHEAVTVIAGDAEAQESAVTPAEPEQTVSETPSPEQDKESVRRNAGRSETWSDPFALMAYEDLHKKSDRKTSVGISGLVGTNDGAKPGSHMHGAMGASGVKAQEGVFEDGESVYGVPVSMGLGMRFHLSDRLALGTGVTWSSLTRNFDGRIASGSDVTRKGNVSHSVQYIGIPVNLSYDIVSNKVLDFYTFGGGSVEKAVSSRYRAENQTVRGDVGGLQYSAALGLGVQFNLGEHVGLYLDPSARYWMGKDQPKSIRTQQPLMFNIEVGLRFEL